MYWDDYSFAWPSEGMQIFCYPTKILSFDWGWLKSSSSIEQSKESQSFRFGCFVYTIPPEWTHPLSRRSRQETNTEWAIVPWLWAVFHSGNNGPFHNQTVKEHGFVIEWSWQRAPGELLHLSLGWCLRNGRNPEAGAGFRGSCTPWNDWRKNKIHPLVLFINTQTHTHIVIPGRAPLQRVGRRGV